MKKHSGPRRTLALRQTGPAKLPTWKFWLYLNYMNAVEVTGWTRFDARAVAIVLLRVDGTSPLLRWKGEPFSSC